MTLANALIFAVVNDLLATHGPVTESNHVFNLASKTLKVTDYLKTIIEPRIYPLIVESVLESVKSLEDYRFLTSDMVRATLFHA